MTTRLTAYTPLETLLLFQSLASYGVDPSIFSRISDLLKKNPHINTVERFDSGRLSPDALRNHYLTLLKEEAQSELGDSVNGDSDSQNGEVKNQRKRKAPSPSLPTVQEALQHSHLIPKLVAKLYSRYRTFVTDQIREEERNYDRLQRELQEIERGEWDNKLRSRDVASGKLSVSQAQIPTSGSPQLATKGTPVAPASSATASDVQQASGTQQATPSGSQRSPGSRNGQAKIEAVINHATDASPHAKSPSLNQHGTYSTSQPAPGQLHRSPNHNRTPSQPFATPKLPPPQYPGYNASPPTAHRSPYTPQPQQGQVSGTSASPTSQNAPLPGHPPSPVLLPPPPGMQYHPPPPVPSFAANGVPQYSGSPPLPPLQYSPSSQRYAMPYPPSGQPSPGMPIPSQTTQQQRNYYQPYPGHQTPYPPPQQQQLPQFVQPQHQGGIFLPPFQVTPQDPTRAHHQQQKVAQQAAASTPNGRPPPGSSRPGTALSSRPEAHGYPAAQQIVNQTKATLSTPSSIRTPRPPLTILTPSSETRWKPSAQKLPKSPTRAPTASPIDDFAPPLELPKQSSTPSQPTKPRRKGKTKETARSEDNAGDVEVCQMRNGQKPTKRERGGSTTSSLVESSIRGRTRSQSVASHAETMSADNESNAGYKVKTEPGTSADIIEEDAVTDATHTSVTTIRRCGGTLQSLPLNKRKRKAREASVADSEEILGTPGPQTVIASRHFSRMSNPIMNDILSHKHASLFSIPVKEKDAEGYYDIIKRPQDLKSIRTAISAGAKTVQAAATADTPAGSPGGGGGNVILPLSAEVVPPKAIVNSAQLENELMRMFVNAVMFNTGEDGVVQDAKEMYETVQHSVSNWRNAERSTGRFQSEDLGVEEETPVAAKRRKV